MPEFFQKKLFLPAVVCIVLIYLAAALNASQEGPEEFGNAEKQGAGNKTFASEQEEFEQYKKEVKKEFDRYRKTAAREFRKYRQEILKKWKHAKVSSKKRWVEYSEDYESRRTVDFEKGLITLELIVSGDESKSDIDRAVDRNLADLVVEDQKTAFRRSSLARGTEAEIKKKEPAAVSSKVEKKPILAKVLTGSAKPDKKQVEKAVSKLKKKAEVSRDPSKIEGRQVVKLRTELPPGSLRKKAMEYRAEIQAGAGERGLDPALVFAIIHTESAFNPMARSDAPAYGLMQIVPQAGGRDASELIFGEPRTLSPSYLYNGGKNIKVGTSYLYILFNRYLKDIESPESRLYCAVAAYNTGAGNVARAFTGTKNISRAAGRINKRSPEEVYKQLVRKLPYSETRKYLKKVRSRMKMYSGM